MGENIVIPLIITFITADIAGMLHTKLQDRKFSVFAAIIYMAVINLVFICYMLFSRHETFSIYVYYFGPKAELRYVAFTLGLCATAPIIFAILTKPKRILSAIRSIWLVISVVFILALSSGAYLAYKSTESVSLTFENPDSP